MTLKEWIEENKDKVITITENGVIELNDPEQPGRWKPKRGDIYWSIHGDGEAYAKEWKDSLFDQINYSMGNVFKNEPEAKSEIERMKIRAELLDCGGKEAREIVMPADRIYTYRYKIILDNYRKVTYQRTCLPTAFEITFETDEEAHAAIHKVGANRIKKYLFGIEDYA